MVQTARKFYGENNFISHNDHNGHDPAEFRDTGFVSGHFGYDYARELMKSRFSFTFLRDPVERVLSFYYFCRRSNPDEFAIYRLAQEKTIEDFLKMALDHHQVKPYIWNHQTWQLACGWGNMAGKSILNYDQNALIDDARTHLAEFDYIGSTETFDQDILTIFSKLGIARTVRPVRTNVGEPRSRTRDLPSSIRDRLRRITGLDQVLYDYAMSLRQNGRERKDLFI